jgi:coenzyme PQQ precursor peptide PqqA
MPDHANAICSYHGVSVSNIQRRPRASPNQIAGEHIMKTWTKPAVRETEVGLEVTSYLPAEIDII